MLHIIELLSVILGGGAAILRFWPQFRALAIAFQVAMFLVNVFNTYLKTHPDKKKVIQLHISQMAEHYFTTHPQGREIAEKTDIDDKFHSYLKKEEKADPYNELYRLLGIPVDKSQNTTV